MSDGHWEWVPNRKHSLLAFILAIRLIVTFLCPLFLGFSIYFFVQSAKYEKIIQQNIIVEDIINNPGEAWEEWALLWEVPNATWNDLEEPFIAVQQDWEDRGIVIDWEYMSQIFRNILAPRTFTKFENALYGRIKSDFYKQCDSNAVKSCRNIGIVYIVLGSVLLVYLAFMTKKGGIKGLFFKIF